MNKNINKNFSRRKEGIPTTLLYNVHLFVRPFANTILILFCTTCLQSYTVQTYNLVYGDELECKLYSIFHSAQDFLLNHLP